MGLGSGFSDVLEPILLLKLMNRGRGGRGWDKDKTPSYSRGGTVRESGVAKLHKGERIKPPRKGRSRSGR